MWFLICCCKLMHLKSIQNKGLSLLQFIFQNFSIECEQEKSKGCTTFNRNVERRMFYSMEIRIRRMKRHSMEMAADRGSVQCITSKNVERVSQPDELAQWNTFAHHHILTITNNYFQRIQFSHSPSFLVHWFQTIIYS